MGTGHVDDGHVGDIEYTAITSDLMVFFHLRAVMQRHVPAAEINHFRAECHMLVIKGSALTHGFLLLGRSPKWQR
jgi:hypothetical protein